MQQRGILLLALIAALRMAGIFIDPSSPPAVVSLERACLGDGSETALLCGRPLRLLLVNQAELELVPGVTDRIARGLLSHKESLADQVRYGALDETEALVRLPDIGPKRAIWLSRYLALN